MTVQVVTYSFQGVLDSVDVFDTEEKALNHLRELTGENFKNVKDFGKWQEANTQNAMIGRADEEYHWFEVEVQ